MLQIKASESTAARRRIPLHLVDDTDGKTPETGVSFSAGDIKVSKNGGAEANHAGTVTELAGGTYYYEATSGECDTVGFLSARFVKSGVRTFVAVAQVVAFDPYDAVRMGQTALPNATAGASGGLWILGSMTGSPAITGSFSIANASGAAMTLLSAGSNGAGLVLAGNGSGAGLSATGGATGAGFALVGGATSGHAMSLVATAGNSYGLLAQGAGAGAAHGAYFDGNGTGDGLRVVSGTGATGSGAHIASRATNGAALNLAGAGSGNGLLSTGGATGAGVSAVGGATSGHGISAVASAGNSSGLVLQGAGSGAAHGVSIVGSGTGDGLRVVSGTGATGAGVRIASLATNGDALQLVGAGSGDGVDITAGGSGVGLRTTGGVSITGTFAFGAITATSVLVVNPAGTAVGFIGTDGGLAITSTVGHCVTFASPSDQRGLFINGGSYGIRIDCQATNGVGIFADGGATGGAAIELHGNGGRTFYLSAPTSGLYTGEIITADGILLKAAYLAGDTITASKVATSAVDEIVDAVFDEAASGHSTAGTLGEVVTRLGRLFITAGTAQGGSSSTITLASGASSTNDIYNGQTVVIYGGTGAGQSRRISDYVGSTRVATILEAWGVTPDNTSTYMVIGSPAGDTSVAGGLTAGQQAQLDAIEDATALIVAGGVTISSPVSADGELLTLVRGDTYNVASGQPITFSAAAGVWPDLTGATAKTFTIRDASGASVLTATPTVTASGAGAQSIRVDLTSAETAALVPGDPPGEQDHKFDVQVTLSDGTTKVTLVLGAVAILEDMTTA